MINIMNKVADYFFNQYKTGLFFQGYGQYLRFFSTTRKAQVFSKLLLVLAVSVQSDDNFTLLSALSLTAISC